MQFYIVEKGQGSTPRYDALFLYDERLSDKPAKTFRRFLLQLYARPPLPKPGSEAAAKADSEAARKTKEDAANQIMVMSCID
jgi:hypothetical protein